MAVLYRVKDWDAHFENNRTRELKQMDWVPIPNKLDGDGYTELVSHPDGAAHFGAWVGIVEVASKCRPRGTLLRDGGIPHDAASLSRITRLPAAVFEAAIPRLVSIGWLASEVIVSATVEEIPQEGAGTSAESRMTVRESDYGTEGNGTEGNGREDRLAAQATGVPADAAPPAVAVFLTFATVGGKRNKATEWHLREDYVSELSEAFPDIDVRAECRKALAWTRAKSANRKTAGGMREFLHRWMARVADRGGSRGNGSPGYAPEAPEEQARRVADLMRKRDANGAHA